MNSASLCSLAGRYENPIPPRCLAPIDFLKIPALAGRYDNPIPTWFKNSSFCLREIYRFFKVICLAQRLYNIRNHYTYASSLQVNTEIAIGGIIREVMYIPKCLLRIKRCHFSLSTSTYKKHLFYQYVYGYHFTFSSFRWRTFCKINTLAIYHRLKAKSIEWFIEDQAFLRSYYSAPRPPTSPSLPSPCLSVSVFMCVAGRA